MDEKELKNVMPEVEVIREGELDTSFVEKRKKSSILRIFINLIFTILVIGILGNACIGVVNFNQLSNQKKPMIFTEMTEEVKGDKTYKIYPQGLFKIILETDSKGEKWTLKPFFLS